MTTGFSRRSVSEPLLLESAARHPGRKAFALLFSLSCLLLLGSRIARSALTRLPEFQARPTGIQQLAVKPPSVAPVTAAGRRGVLALGVATMMAKAAQAAVPEAGTMTYEDYQQAARKRKKDPDRAAQKPKMVGENMMTGDNVYATNDGFKLPSLTAKQYVQNLEANFDPARADLTRLVERKLYNEASASLLLQPFDPLKQSCYYLPAAVAMKDPDAGERMKQRWVTLRSELESFDSVILAAARNEASEDDALKALGSLWREFEEYRVAAAETFKAFPY